jgi:hypothetical protein
MRSRIKEVETIGEEKDKNKKMILKPNKKNKKDGC